MNAGQLVQEFGMQPDDDCPHLRVIGDNYKEECQDCGKIVWHLD